MKKNLNLFALSLCAAVVAFGIPAFAQFNLGGFLEKADDVNLVDLAA